MDRPKFQVDRPKFQSVCITPGSHQIHVEIQRLYQQPRTALLTRIQEQQIPGDIKDVLIDVDADGKYIYAMVKTVHYTESVGHVSVLVKEIVEFTKYKIHE